MTIEQEADWIDEVCNTWKIDPDYTFSMQSVYFTADGKRLTFREVLLAGYARGQERQWIKCSEQLPEPYTPVLVYAEGRMLGVPFYVTAQILEGSTEDGKTSLEWAWVNDEDCEFCSFYEDPTLWSPLPPTPPNEEGAK